jgi:hypothetical protein
MQGLEAEGILEDFIQAAHREWRGNKALARLAVELGLVEHSVTQGDGVGASSKLSENDLLRKHLIDILRVKFSDVFVNHVIGNIKVDIFYIDDTSSDFPRPIAIHLSERELGAEELCQLELRYRPLLTTREIDYLKIIGAAPLDEASTRIIKDFRFIRYSTADEFMAQQMNFSRLLRANINTFRHHECYGSFIAPRSADTQRPMLDTVVDWLSGPQQGLIIYGGYGLGKTTFSLYLASYLSEQYILSNFSRIPIRIALGGLYTKQDITSLICTTLIGERGFPGVKDFSYDLFLESNEQGHYVVILDGFDEMRHALSKDDFIFIFEQINSIFVGRAKIIILGRPDAFLTNSEEEEVLSSLLNDKINLNAFITKVEMAFFSSDQINHYLQNWMAANGIKDGDQMHASISSLIDGMKEDKSNILSRPVQLNMFTKIARELTNVELSRYDLYSKFIYRFINREMKEKNARSDTENLAKIGTGVIDDRVAFMRRMAWWVLTVKKENRFLPEEIPFALVPASINKKAPKISALREALIGSIMEPMSQLGALGRKGRKYYFFPHKSYMEFLVAEYFCSRDFDMTSAGFKNFLEHSNNEILSFIGEGPSIGAERVRELLRLKRGSADARLFKICARDPNINKQLTDRKSKQVARMNAGKTSGNKNLNEYVDVDPADIYTYYFFAMRDELKWVEAIKKMVLGSQNVSSMIAAFNCTRDYLAKSGDMKMARLILLKCLMVFADYPLRSVHPVKIYNFDDRALRFALLRKCVNISPKNNKVELYVSDMYDPLLQAARGALFAEFETGKSQFNQIVIPLDGLRELAQKNSLPNVLKIISADFASRINEMIVFSGEAEQIFG